MNIGLFTGLRARMLPTASFSLLMPRDVSLEGDGEIGVVYGWKAWSTMGDSRGCGFIPYLFPLVMSQASSWQPLAARRAACFQYGHPTPGKVPAPGCNCGIYASTELPAELSGHGLVIFGIVACWGEVFFHERGHRSEWSYPVALAMEHIGAESEIFARSLSSNYRVPVKLFEAGRRQRALLALKEHTVRSTECKTVSGG